jgi:hypothetical protein
MFNNKRKSQRRPMRYTAWIAQKGKPLLGCVVADISDSGARLNVEEPDSLPDQFMLVLSRRGDAQRKCRVVWRKKRQIGVEFSNSRSAKVNAMLEAFAKPRGSRSTSETEPALS